MKTRGLLTAPIVLVVTGLAFSVLTAADAAWDDRFRGDADARVVMGIRHGSGRPGDAGFLGALFVGLALLGNGKQKRDLLAT